MKVLKCFVNELYFKRSSAPGLRSGFIAGDEQILKEYLQYRTYVGCASPVPLQEAAAVAWNDQEHVEGFRKFIKRIWNSKWDFRNSNSWCNFLYLFEVKMS